ncbi:MAG: TetR/AcrR family transcriptional regulator [Acidimicrobiia bacterium]
MLSCLGRLARHLGSWPSEHSTSVNRKLILAYSSEIAEPVKPRRYSSPRRQEQAAATRSAILAAARRLFEADGYRPTTIEAIATEVGVSSKTVYLAFATKAGLLRAVWDLALKGDEQPAGVAERSWYQEVLADPDAEHALRTLAHHSVIVKQRIAGVLGVIRAAADIDEDLASLWQLIETDFWANQRAVVERLRATRSLRRGLDVVPATDILWTLNHPSQWQLLVVQRGWSPASFEQWLADTMCEQLLGPRRTHRSKASAS